MNTPNMNKHIVQIIDLFIETNKDNMSWKKLVDFLNTIRYSFKINLREIKITCSDPISGIKIADSDSYNNMNAQNINLLSYYSIKGNILMVKVLTEYFRFDIDDLKNSGFYNDICKYLALLFSCQKSTYEIVKYLCEHFKITSDIIRSYSNFCIRGSCYGHNTKIAKYLIKTYNLSKSDIMSPSHSIYDRSPGWLFNYMNRDNRDIIEYIVRYYNICLTDLDINNYCNNNTKHLHALISENCRLAELYKSNYEKVIREIQDKPHRQFFQDDKNKQIAEVFLNTLDCLNIDIKKLVYYSDNIHSSK